MEKETQEEYLELAMGNIWDQLEYLNSLEEKTNTSPPWGIIDILTGFLKQVFSPLRPRRSGY